MIMIISGYQHEQCSYTFVSLIERGADECFHQGNSAGASGCPCPNFNVTRTSKWQCPIETIFSHTWLKVVLLLPYGLVVAEILEKSWFQDYVCAEFAPFFASAHPYWLFFYFILFFRVNCNVKQKLLFKKRPVSICIWQWRFVLWLHHMPHQEKRPPSFRLVAAEMNALLRGNKWRIWGEPFEIEMQSERQARRRFSHINMCLSGPSPPSGGGPQHQMEHSLVYV